jgi:hypothetical protein
MRARARFAALTAAVVASALLLEHAVAAAPILSLRAANDLPSPPPHPTLPSLSLGATATSPNPPFSPAPAFSLPLLGGGATTTATYTPASPTPTANFALPLFVVAYNNDDGFSSVMWSDGPNSLDPFLLQTQDAPGTFLFLSWASDPAVALAEVSGIQAALYARLAALNLPASAVAAWKARLLFCPTPVPALDAGNAWIPTMLQNWTSPTEGLVVPSLGPSPSASFLPHVESHYMWLPWRSPGDNVTIVYGGDGCSPTPPAPLNKTFNGATALVTWQGHDSPCDYADAVNAAQSAGAGGLVLVQAPFTALADMNCAGDTECNLPLGIPASMMRNDVAQPLLLAAQASGAAGVEATYTEAAAPAFSFAINSAGLLGELGWVKIPTAMYVGWSAQHEIYMDALRANLSLPGALVAPVFSHTLMLGAPGAVANITLPLPPAALAAYDIFEVEGSLECPTPWDTSCAIWDRTVQLTVCCEGSPCNASQPTANPELARWISPFRRGSGRWLTDVTPLGPLLTGSQCSLTMYTDSWAMPWYVSVSLRWRNISGAGTREQPGGVGGASSSSSSISAAAAAVPLVTVPLWGPGASFDSNFSTHFPPLSVPTPAGATRAVLSFTISDHGSDNNGCGEFCPISHQVTLDGGSAQPLFNTTILLSPDAGTLWGCADESVINGGLPNEHGTWFLGRGGWCDGQNVPPHVWDVTANMAPAGKPNNITYAAFFGGLPPDPTASPGYIIHHSYITFYG